MNVLGADWQVSVVSISFMTDCSAEASGSGKYAPPVSDAICGEPGLVLRQGQARC